MPMWVWLAIAAAVVVLIALWQRHKSSASSSSSDTGQNGPGVKSFGASLIPPVVIHARGGRGRGDDDDDDDQRPGGKGHGKHKPKPKGRPGPMPNPGGPRKGGTGGGGPGAGGSGGGPSVQGNPMHTDPDRDRDPGQHEQEKRPVQAMTRGIPGQPGAAVPGTLLSYTTPAAGVSPSLSQIASRYDTTPDAIVEEATGRGSPHGAMWRRYVAAHDWEAPLPHGTDMTILARQA